MGTAASPPAVRGTLHWRRQGARLWVSWQLEGGTHTEQLDRWGELRADWRRTFPKHRDATYSHTRREWSVPLRQRERLLEWCACWGLEIADEEEGDGGMDEQSAAGQEHEESRPQIRSWSRAQLTDWLPDAPAPRRSQELAAGTIGTPRSGGDSGGDPQDIPPRWWSYLAPQVGLRPYALSLVAQLDTQAGQAYGLMLDWMDRNGYPPPEQVYRPRGLLAHLSGLLEVSEQTIRRRLERAEELLDGLSLTFS